MGDTHPNDSSCSWRGCTSSTCSVDSTSGTSTRTTKKPKFSPEFKRFTSKTYAQNIKVDKWNCFVMEHDVISSFTCCSSIIPNICLSRDASTKGRDKFVEKGWRCESFTPSNGMRPYSIFE